MHREEFEQIVQAERDKHRAYEHHINVCTALGCVAYGSEKVVDALEAEVKERGLEHKCKITGVGCLGLCGSGPIMKTEPDNQFYQSVKPSDSADIIDHLGEPYTPGDVRRERDSGGGLGLGLFIAKTLLARSGASVTFRNSATPGLGAQVTVRWLRQALEFTS